MYQFLKIVGILRTGHGRSKIKKTIFFQGQNVDNTFQFHFISYFITGKSEMEESLNNISS